jgi:hypothetical protein
MPGMGLQRLLQQKPAACIQGPAHAKMVLQKGCEKQNGCVQEQEKSNQAQEEVVHYSKTTDGGRKDGCRNVISKNHLEEIPLVVKVYAYQIVRVNLESAILHSPKPTNHDRRYRVP